MALIPLSALRPPPQARPPLFFPSPFSTTLFDVISTSPSSQTRLYHFSPPCSSFSRHSFGSVIGLLADALENRFTHSDTFSSVSWVNLPLFVCLIFEMSTIVYIAESAVEPPFSDVAPRLRRMRDPLSFSLATPPVSSIQIPATKDGDEDEIKEP
ncbi:uncharacterized protein FOMMEDRAFT_158737 [Fomitiporia mediterranea MF3/22]|uniref:uncharacterized protein n=1 Tax=Fomitiporia mediterranea (strain MF3/22) TaxID=694068 RepID=UPI0004408C6B|nr:uncharacterized protein FOMMEDRAFT_158737 [Fomitiporia mediterranea MF3/22]EJD01584.1 hypothetical protein FOMMEDRAFT_158737 [Fomitiporia mediterranea MF3/22]